jgi:hypothetical protein
MNARLTYGIKNNQLYSINDVESGLSCGLHCALCNDQLIAKKGKKTKHHFAHYRIENCQGAVETALHLLAKEIIDEEKEITLPSVELKIGEKREAYIFHKETKVHFQNVKVENRLDNIIPDLICYVQGQPLLIEIAVTHFIDKEKRRKIKKLNLSTIEIDLSEFKQGIEKEELKEILISGTNRKKWIYNKRLRFINNSIQSERNKIVDEYDFEGSFVTRRWHMKCPISKNGFASYMDDCSYCLYNNEIYQDYIVGGKISVKCSGKNSKKIMDKISELGGMPISNI